MDNEELRSIMEAAAERVSNDSQRGLNEVSNLLDDISGRFEDLLSEVKDHVDDIETVHSESVEKNLDMAMSQIKDLQNDPTTKDGLMQCIIDMMDNAEGLHINQEEYVFIMHNVIREASNRIANFALVQVRSKI